MAINPAPNVQIVENINATANNTNSIIFNVVSQSEVITSVSGDIYKLIDGAYVKICTYTNPSSPFYTSSGYLFPIWITASTPATQITWESGYSASDWVNNASYYIQLKVTSISGSSSLSISQPFTTHATPTATFTAISSPLAITTVNPEVTVTTTTTNLIERYRFVLIDMSNNNIVNDSGVIYGSGTAGAVSSTYVFTTGFSSLEEDKVYKIQFNAYTVNNAPVSVSSNVFKVTTGYALQLGATTVVNDCDYGRITINATITGQTKPQGATADINYVRIERAIANTTPYNWVVVTEKEVAIPASGSVEVTHDDYYAKSGESYIYRLVPLVVQGSFVIAGAPSMIDITVLSRFTYIYIVDKNSRYQLLAGTAYDSQALNQQTGVATPLGSTYPIVVRNANTKYKTGGFSGTVVPIDMLSEDAQLTSLDDRYAIRKFRDEFEGFLVNGSPKIIKDWNGNIWLVEITDSISTDFDSNVGMGIASVRGSWTEIGDVEDAQTLIQSGLVDVRG